MVWHALTLPTHVTAHAGYAAQAALIAPGFVAISAWLVIDSTGITASNPIATLPVSSLFPVTAKAILMGDSNSNEMPTFIDTSGNISCLNSLASVNVRINVIVPIGF